MMQTTMTINKQGSMKEIAGGVTAPLGFAASGVHCGIRKAKKDVAMIVSDVPASVAAVFTLNKTIAAPIVVNKMLMKKSSKCKVVIANSGNANACTGERGYDDAWAMVNMAADSLNVPVEQVLVASTGVIGQYLPIEKVLSGIQEAA